MIMDYRFPALVKGTAGSSKITRHLLVAMRGRAEIEELDYADAPLAATVYMPWGKANYRSHRGRLYREALNSQIDEFASGLDTHMALNLANACRQPVGRDIRPWPDAASTSMRNVVIMKDNFRPIRGEYLKIVDHEWAAMLTLGALSSYEQQDLERWTDIAARYVADLISLDGDLWIPVAEPMLAIVNRETPFASYVDATLYEGRHDNPKDQPAPFGRRAGFTSNYWNPETRFHSLLDVADLLDGETGAKVGCGDLPWLRKPEIFMPSAFVQDYASKELDRAARVAVAEVHLLCKEVFGPKTIHGGRVPPTLKGLLSEARQIMETDELSDEQGDLLLGKLGRIKTWIVGLQSEAPRLVGASEIISLIKDTEAMWANREISLDVTWSQPKAPRL